MSVKKSGERRNHVGYGSSYRKENGKDLGDRTGIAAVLGGQVWKVRPDRRARTDNPCIWMQAGVAEYKNCNNFGDCTNCKYDAGMRKKAGEGRQMTWQEAMRMRGGLDRVCRHSLTGRIEKRSCAYNYECSRCDFDQYFEDVWSARTGSIPYEVQTVRGFHVPMGYYFHGGHTWARIESGGYVRVGMDDFSLKLLGAADVFDLPLTGKELDGDRIGWGLKRGGNSAGVRSPVGGVIVEVNSELRQNPGIANSAPYEAGWLFLVRTADIRAAARGLMDDIQCLRWMNGEVARLEHMIESAAGPLALDGGILGNDIYGNLPALGWDNLTRSFLKTSGSPD